MAPPEIYKSGGGVSISLTSNYLLPHASLSPSVTRVLASKAQLDADDDSEPSDEGTQSATPLARSVVVPIARDFRDL